MTYKSSLYDTLKENHDDDTSNYYVMIALKNNGIVSSNAFQMLDLACRLEETYPEHSKNKIHVSRKQNQLFTSFRLILRNVYYSTKDQIKKSKLSQENKLVLDKIEQYINKPYGTYDIRNLVQPSIEYYGILCVKGIVPLVLGYSMESSYSKWTQ